MRHLHRTNNASWPKYESVGLDYASHCQQNVMPLFRHLRKANVILWVCVLIVGGGGGDKPEKFLRPSFRGTTLPRSGCTVVTHATKWRSLCPLTSFVSHNGISALGFGASRHKLHLVQSSEIRKV